jgi:hypothetical protein
MEQREPVVRCFGCGEGFPRRNRRSDVHIRSGTAISWKRQNSIGVIRADGKLFFRDDQGSTFVFTMENQRVLTGLFGGSTGRLNADFEKVH